MGHTSFVIILSICYVLFLCTEVKGCNTKLPQHSGSGCVTLYEHCNYGGWGRSYGPGRHDLDHLLRTGTCNDRVSAVKVKPGCKLVIYEHHHFGGASLELTHDVPCLVNHKLGRGNWNDKLSSIIIHSTQPVVHAAPANHIPPCNKNLPAHTGNGCITIFEHCNYGGWGRSYGAGDFNLKKLHETGTCNDHASAVKVKPGCKVTIYQHDNFGGHSLEITNDIPCLVNHKMGNTNTNWNDHLSSIRVHGLPALPAPPAPPANHIPPCNKNLPAKSGSGCVRFFEHCDYKGWSRAYGQGDYTLKQFHETGTCNDQISAVKVKPGCKVTIFQHDHFGGHSLEITQDIPCLVHHKMGNSNTNWNDHMSSAKIHGTASEVDDVISDHELKKLLHGV